MKELEKKLREGIPKAFAAFGIFIRFNEKQDELIEVLVKFYKLIVYIVEGREIE